MRRKSERTASKKTKPSPEKAEKKVDNPKRTRSRRKKQSTSSENESAGEASPVREVPAVVAESEQKLPTTPVKSESQEESQDQVWQVKTGAASDVGEIQKLKICLTRPPSTPERAERSPRSKRKHSRATSSSDTPSVEAPEERRKSKHRSKRSHRESKDESDKNLDSQGEDHEVASGSQQNASEVTQSEPEQKPDTSTESENTISTSAETKQESNQVESNTSDDKEDIKGKVESSDDVSGEGKESTEKADKPSDADTTVDSPKAETTAVSAPETESSANTESQDSQSDANTSELTSHSQSPARRRSMSVDKSEILELHPEESKCESDVETDKSKVADTKEDARISQDEEQVSKIEDQSLTEETKSDNDISNKTGVVEKSKRTRSISTDSHNDVRKSTDKKEENKDTRRSISSETPDLKKSQESKPEENHKTLDHSDSIQSNQSEETIHNGQAIIPIVVSRKRRWGSRPAKITKQKSITISTDILKDIIPDVKPVEFEEVIEEKKQINEREVVEKIERPILPKIVIDNTENVERNIEHRRHSDEKNRDRDIKPKEPHLAASRKISIIKDNDSIITRPPSPPRHKQSCVLYITNLVRPFTIPQLKNLLQRTGRLVENGFWIDKIKSKCYVIYENEDQAVETRHALHGVTWPVSNPKSLQVDFSSQEAFEKAKLNEVADNAQVSTIPGTVEDWLREQDMKRERGELDKPWERKLATREWDLGKNDKDKDKEKDKLEKRRDDQRPMEKRRHNRTPERSPEPARKFKKKEEEPPAKLLDDLFKKTKATPCIYWLPLSAETIAIKEEQRRQHMAEHERRMLEQRRPARRH